MIAPCMMHHAGLLCHVVCADGALSQKVVQGSLSGAYPSDQENVPGRGLGLEKRLYT